MGSAFKIVARAGGHLVHEHFFRDTTTEQHTDLVQHVFAIITVAILRRQTHGHAQRPTARNNGHFMHGVALGQNFADERVPRFMVRGVAALFFGHHHALAFWAHQDFVFGSFKVLHFHDTGVTTRRHQCRFVAKIRQIRTRHTGRAACNHARANVLTQRNFAHVNAQNLFAPANIGQRYIHLAVKTTRTQQSGIQNIGAIGCRNHDNAEVGFKAVHLNQHLIEGLFALIVTAAQTRTTLATDRINLVDKDDARRILFGVLEHIAHTGCAHTHEHFHEVGTRNAKERHFRFARNGFRQ